MMIASRQPQQLTPASVRLSSRVKICAVFPLFSDCYSVPSLAPHSHQQSRRTSRRKSVLPAPHARQTVRRRRNNRPLISGLHVATLLLSTQTATDRQARG